MPEPENSESRRVLTTWKEIASFFSREVRTVQRWEKEEGLPVHRHLHQRQSSVYAYPDELEAWWQHRGAALSQTSNGHGDDSPSPAPRPLWLKWTGAAAALAGILAVAWFAVGWRSTGKEPPAFPAVVLDGTRPSALLNASLIGDLNGDGIGDQVFNASEVQEVYVVFGGAHKDSPAAFPAAADIVISSSLNGTLDVQQRGDFNGDGLPDLFLSVTLYEPDMLRDTGPSFILFGRREWPHQLRVPDDANVTLRYVAPSDPRSGGCLAARNGVDLDGDGIDDVFTGGADWSHGALRSPGGVHILRGRKQWPREVDVFAAADITIAGSRSGEGLGNQCATGDFNGDGITDLAVGANEGTLWKLLGGVGRVYLFLGQPSWPTRLDAQSDSTAVFQNVPIYNGAVPVLADVNGDGKDDLAVSGTSDMPLRIWFGRERPQPTYNLDSADVVIRGPAASEEWAYSLAAADIDGDSVTDLLLGDPGRGTILLLPGRPDWKKTGDLADYDPVTLFSGDRGTGLRQLAVGDADGDGLPEIAFTNPYAGAGERAQAGRAWVLKPHLPLPVDVRPGHQPNVIYYPDGLVVVRVPGMRDSPPIDPATARLAGAAPERYVFRDDDGDGIEDLTLHFPTRKMRITPETTRVILTARTRDGRLLAGSDVVEVIVQSATAGSPSSVNGDH